MCEEVGVIQEYTCDLPAIIEAVSCVTIEETSATRKETSATERDYANAVANNAAHAGVDIARDHEVDDACCAEKKKRHRTRKRKAKNKTNSQPENTTVADVETQTCNIPSISKPTQILQSEGCAVPTVHDCTCSAVFFSEVINDPSITPQVICEMQDLGNTINFKKSRRRSRKRTTKKNSAPEQLPETREKSGSQNVINSSRRERNVEGQKSNNRKRSPRNNTNKSQKFEKYLLQREVEEGLQNGTLIKGIIRINPKNYKEAFISDTNDLMDISITGLQKRNRALEGDEVIVQLDPPSEWKPQLSDTFQKTGKVVFISECNHLKVGIGTLKKMNDENSYFALFSPRDARIPRMKIPLANCPVEFLLEPETYKNTLILAKIIEWTNVSYALGEIVEHVGAVGDIGAETVAILRENGLDVEPFPDFMKSYFPQSPYHIDQQEIKNRVDMRKECIFTIDPRSAKDLDDAMSCKLLDNGNFEVGVHISDVTYFLKAETPLDKAVSKKATSVYLVDAVHHMLPRELCMLCSLLPGEDKLAFSLIWEMTPNADVVSQQFTRSVINSCSQLAYDHVQTMIENPDREWNKEELPPISGEFDYKDIVLRVLWLHKLASIIRKRRFDGGALRIDQTKILMSLDESSSPVAYSCYVNNDSHRLIEEFMLLANVSVADQLHTDNPSLAFLRCHPEPLSLMLSKVKTSFEKRGIHLDISSAGALQTSMWRYDGNDYYSQARMMVIASLCARSMSRAKYFCSGFTSDFDEFKHYALNVPLYTHFTSPIRRYADIMVHRLLGASLGYYEKPKWTTQFVQRIAANCNRKKYSAKLAGEQSTKLFFTVYLRLHGPVEEDAVVMDVKDHSFDVLVCSTGLSHRVYSDKLNAEIEHESQNGTLKILWLPSEGVTNTTYQVIEIFSLVRVKLQTLDEQFKIHADLLRPNTQHNEFSSTNNFIT